MEPYKTVDIAFGRGHLTVGLPEQAEATVIRKATLPKLADQTGAIHAAFDNPIDAPPLATLAQGRKQRLHPDLRYHPPGARTACSSAP